MSRPNFLVIVADDLGFSDVGCFGGEIRTPNLDKLASQGVRLTNFHTASACSPTRSMLMSGTDNHIAGVGAMVEHFNDAYAQEMWVGQPGHEGHLVHTVAALPELLRDAGYHTMMTGKWHLGFTSDTIPAARGFDRSYSLLPGGASHYAWEPDFADDPRDNSFKEFQPSHYDARNKYTDGHKFFSMPPNFPTKPGGFFSTDSFTDKMLSYFDERKASSDLKSKPFLAYLAFTAPHFPLQASKARIAKYSGVYDDGPAALRDRRLARMLKLGLYPEGIKAHDMVNPYKMTEWDDMTAEEKAKSSRAMEVYAAMVEQLDENVGRVLDKLERDGEMDNTFVLFMSDNGAEGSSYEVYPSFGPSLMQTIDKYYNNDLDNIGEADSFVWYGNFWAQASTAPGWLYKMYTSQGGIRVPFILRYPPFLQARNLKGGDIIEPFCTVMDLLPTFMDLADSKHPASRGMPSEYKGRTVVPVRGKSWRRWFEGRELKVHDDGIPIGWELHGRAALRMGDWKILWIPPPQGTGDWQLFNIATDPGETRDLSRQQQQKLVDMLVAWDKYVSDSQVRWVEPSGFGETVMMDETANPNGWMRPKYKQPTVRPLL